MSDCLLYAFNIFRSSIIMKGYQLQRELALLWPWIFVKELECRSRYSDGSTDRMIRVLNLVQNVRIVSGFHPVFCWMRDGIRFRVWSRRDLNVTTHLHVVPPEEWVELYLYFPLCPHGVDGEPFYEYLPIVLSVCNGVITAVNCCCGSQVVSDLENFRVCVCVCVCV